MIALILKNQSGVGKSTLIRKVFGVEDVNVSNRQRGQADIERELVTPDNEFFVAHDSLGFEAGDGDNLDRVKHFIRQRRAMTAMKDKLHAIWVCLPIQYAKRRLLETGMEFFLRERKEILGDIPVVVVLTKLDLLHNQLLAEVLEEGAVKNLGEALVKVEQEGPKLLETYCTKPLRAAAGDIPHVAVSAQGEIAATLSELVKITISEIKWYIRTDPSYVKMPKQLRFEHDAPFHIARIAFPVGIEAKVDLTLELAKNTWRNLSMNTRLSQDGVKENLFCIHRDIILAWNFNDPEMVLQANDLWAALLDTSDIQDAPDPAALTISSLGALIVDLAKISSALPMAGTTIINSLCSEISKTPQMVVKRFMAYITDLVYVMKILFVLSPQRSVTSQDVARALKVYERAYRSWVHKEVRDFSCDNVAPRRGRDTVMEKIEILVRRYSITDKEVDRLQDQFLDKFQGRSGSSSEPVLRHSSVALPSTRVSDDSESHLPQQIGDHMLSTIMVLWSA